MKTVRISERTMKLLRQASEIDGRPMVAIVQEAVDQMVREWKAKKSTSSVVEEK